jgi:hypothetical protein
MIRGIGLQEKRTYLSKEPLRSRIAFGRQQEIDGLPGGSPQLDKDTSPGPSPLYRFHPLGNSY